MAMKLAEDHRMKMPGVRQRRSLNAIVRVLDRNSLAWTRTCKPSMAALSWPRATTLNAMVRSGKL